MYIQHRNTQKRLLSKGATYFVTSKTLHNYPYFKHPQFCEVFFANLKLCKKLKKFRLYAWVLMYDHIHLLLEPSEHYNLGNIIHFIKRNTSRDINKIMNNVYLENEIIKNSHLEDAPSHPLEDVLLHHPEGAFSQRRLSNKNINQFHETHFDFQYFKWQKSYHDHYIRNQKDLNNHWDYIKLNPIKSEEMPNDWKYISQNPNIESICDEFV